MKVPRRSAGAGLRWLAWLGAAAFLAAGCPEEPAPEPSNDVLDEPVVVTEEARERAVRIYEQRCTVCHGDTGAGDGPGAVALEPRPPDLRDPEWQASVTDEDIAQVTVLGGAGVGKSPVMPANPDLRGQDAVLQALADYIRGLEQ